MAASWTTEELGEGSAAATGTMPAGLMAGLGVTSAGTSERGLGTAALNGVGASELSSFAAFGEPSGMIADGVSAAAFFLRKRSKDLQDFLGQVWRCSFRILLSLPKNRCSRTARTF